MNQSVKTGVPAVEVLTSFDLNPAEFFIEAVCSARQRISAVVYKFTDPDILESLDQALLRSVKVQLLTDSRRAYSSNALASRLSSMGAEVRLLGSEGEKMHAKFMVVDDQRVCTGSSNWTRSARKSNIELLLKLEGQGHPRRFMEIFERMWSSGTNYPDEGHRYVNRS